MTLNNRTIQESILEKAGKAKKNPLFETRELLRMLGDPQKELRIIHVAGTNGKGSCCAFLESILRESGLKTGLFTSPHLIRMNERIQVCGEQISDDELSALSGKIDEAVLKSGVSQPTFFEYMLLAAVLYFRDKAVDIAVIEAGMGGLNDATNILENKEAAVITSIGMDHMQYLGDTIEEIAEQKAGIMRAGVPCYYYAGGEAEEVIISNGRVGGALLRKLDNGMITDTARTPGQVDFFLSYGYHKLGISIKGDALYQRINASLAVMFAIDAGIDEDTIKRGIIRAERPARMEEILPGIFLDGAHNVPAAAALCETLETSFKDREKLIVYGASKDKDIPGVLEVLKDISGVEEIVFTRTGYSRMEDPGRLMEMAGAAGIGCTMKTMDLNDAVRTALNYINGRQRRMALFTGSFYLAGGVRELLEEYNDKL